MKPLLIRCSLITATWLVALSTQLASAQAPANPADVIPDKMPFDLPFGTPIKLEKADQVLSAALAEAQKREWKLSKRKRLTL